MAIGAFFFDFDVLRLEFGESTYWHLDGMERRQALEGLSLLLTFYD
jgi:hypothetical protein